MHLDPELLKQVTAELRADEGVRNGVYDDSTGKSPVLARWDGDRLVPSRGRLTIGVGRNLSDRPISDAVIQLLFNEDIAMVAEAARRLFPAFDEWAQNRKAAVLNLLWNLGEGGLMGFVNTTKAIREDRWGEAANGLIRSLWFKQIQVSRRDRVVKQVRNG
ncbi:glycoside hydrolase family protein [Isosphaeraceae bacterium EP7]